jgi:HK97 family phage major capsid protein
MTLPVGTAGVVPRGAFESDGRGGHQLLGRPVLISSRVKTLGTSGDIILVDPESVIVGMRSSIVVERSSHAYFGSDRLALRGRFRGDSALAWDKPQTPVEGSTTVSPCVVLENR